MVSVQLIFQRPRTTVKNISVKVEEELLSRINDVARLRNLDQKDFIVKTLDEETRKYQKHLNKMKKVEEQIRKEIANELNSGE
jgi:hypothetical protein